MNYVPTEDTVREKMKRDGALFASDEVHALLVEIDRLRLLLAVPEGDARTHAWREVIYESRDQAMTVSETPEGIQFCVGKSHNFRSADVTPEEIAHLNHALSRWIARFTSRA